ncbi:MAG: type II secretion system GspH family protein [Candidatus Pacebacteria bacterium]|nr:type II secretion system GspH family protein [Candidatus Paceibacterota bacterium]MCF7857009.1 type II secretion system GspH family protein [Candidatus Paceibacterota bacterium]
MRFLSSSKRAFTLVEILIVMAVIGILSTIVMSNLQEGRKSARDSQRKSDLQQIQLAMRAYRDAESTSEHPSFAAGDLIGDGLGFDSVFSGYVTGNIKDPLDRDEYHYYYDSSYTCNGVNTVVLVQTMERSGAGNYSSVCSSAPSDLGNGITPTADSYIVILK